MVYDIYYGRNPDVVVRRESFGGIAFNKYVGNLLELDREACLLLEYADGTMTLEDLVEKIERNLGTKIGFSQMCRVVSTLHHLGFLVENIYCTPIDRNHWPDRTRMLSAPESVHLALTHRCNRKCRGCYIDREKNTREMSSEEVISFIDEMAEAKVFQLAIGGGEPLLRDDLVDIVAYADSCGIVPSITTNGSLLTSDIAEKLSGIIGHVQISLNGAKKEVHERTRGEGSFHEVLGANEILLEHDINHGFNMLLCKDNFNQIEDVIELAIRLGAENVNFVRAKPTEQNVGWYEEARLSSEDHQTLGSYLRSALAKYPPVRITVDCALSFLMYEESPQRLRERGVHGCVGATRMLHVYPDGEGYPCSFLDKAEYSGGNVVDDGLFKVWKEGTGLLRARELTDQLKGSCGTCTARQHCGGCRAVVFYEERDIHSSDGGCYINRSIPKDKRVYNTPLAT